MSKTVNSVVSSLVFEHDRGSRRPRPSGKPPSHSAQHLDFGGAVEEARDAAEQQARRLRKAKRRSRAAKRRGEEIEDGTDEVERDFDLKLAKNPSSVTLLHEYALYMFTTARKFNKAQEKFVRGLEIAPGHVGLLCDYGYFLQTARSDLDGAEELFKIALRIDPGDTATLVNYALLLQDGQPVEDPEHVIQRALASATVEARAWATPEDEVEEEEEGGGGSFRRAGPKRDVLRDYRARRYKPGPPFLMLSPNEDWYQQTGTEGGDLGGKDTGDARGGEATKEAGHAAVTLQNDDDGGYERLSRDEKLAVMKAYQDELDESTPLHDYDYCLVFPLDFGNLDPARIAERRASQVEIIRCLRRLHLMVRLIKSRDAEDMLVLIRAPTIQEWCYVPEKRGENYTGEINRSPDLMDWYTFWAEKFKPEYLLREVREGFKHATQPFSFDERHLFVREGEHNPPDMGVPLAVPRELHLPGKRKIGGANKDLARGLGIRVHQFFQPADWDNSIDAYRTAMSERRRKGIRYPAYAGWRNEQRRLGSMRSSSRRLELLTRAISFSLKFNLRNTWFCQEDEELRSLHELVNQFVIRTEFPLHKKEAEEWFKANWANYDLLSLAFWTSKCPQDEICSYFMEDAAFYFAWGQFYNRWLLPPAVFGLGVFVYNAVHYPIISDSSALIIYSLFIAVWSTAFLEAWRRHESTLAHVWGVDSINTEDTVRTQFAGEKAYSIWVSGMDVVTPKEDLRRRLWQIPFLIWSLGACAGIMVALMKNRAVFYKDNTALTSIAAEKSWVGAGSMSMGVLSSVTMLVLDLCYSTLAKYMTDSENFKTEAGYDVALGVKLFVFQIVNSYMFLLVMGFLGFSGQPCNMGTLANLVQEQCTELVHAGFTSEIFDVNDCLIENDVELALMKAEVERIRSGMTIAQLDDPSLVCIEGTTMHNLMLLFMVIFCMRIVVRLLNQTWWKPLMRRAATSIEDRIVRFRAYKMKQKRLEQARTRQEEQRRLELERQGKTGLDDDDDDDDEERPWLSRGRGILEHISILLFGILRLIQNWRINLLSKRRMRRAVKTYNPNAGTEGGENGEDGNQTLIDGGEHRPEEGVKEGEADANDEAEDAAAAAAAEFSFDSSAASVQARHGEFSPLLEYNTHVVQFGFIALFGAFFPLAALLGLAANLLELRIGGVKLVKLSRRCQFRRVKAIRLWVSILEFLAYAGLIVNLLLCSLSSYSIRSLFVRGQQLRKKKLSASAAAAAAAAATYPPLSTQGQDFYDKLVMIWIVVLIEHIILGIKLVYSLTIDDSPDWVITSRTGIANMKYIRMLQKAFAFNDSESDAQTHVGNMTGRYKFELEAAMKETNIKHMWAEMSSAPKERASRPKRIAGLMTSTAVGNFTDDKGIPTVLAEVLERRNKREAAYAVLAQELSVLKPKVEPSKPTSGISRSLSRQSTGKVADPDSATQVASISRPLELGPLARLSIRVLEVVRAHEFGARDMTNRKLQFFLDFEVIGEEELAGSRVQTRLSAAGGELSWRDKVLININFLPARLTGRLYAVKASSDQFQSAHVFRGGPGTKLDVGSGAGRGQPGHSNLAPLGSKGARQEAPKLVGTARFCVSTLKFDVHATEKTVMLDHKKDEWFPLESKQELQSTTPKGAVHLEMALEILEDDGAGVSIGQDNLLSQGSLRPPLGPAANVRHNVQSGSNLASESRGALGHDNSDPDTEEDDPDQSAAHQGRKLVIEAVEGAWQEASQDHKIKTGVGALLLRERQERKLVWGEAPGRNTLVMKVEKGSAVECAGVRADDQILEVDGKDVSRSGMQEVSNLLRGKPGTKISLLLRRLADSKNPQQHFRVEIIRDLVDEMTDDMNKEWGVLSKMALSLQGRRFEVLVEDERKGPFNIDVLLQAWRQGLISRLSLLTCPEMGVCHWTQVSTLPEISFFLDQAGRLPEEEAAKLLRNAAEDFASLGGVRKKDPFLTKDEPSTSQTVRSPAPPLLEMDDDYWDDNSLGSRVSAGLKTIAKHNFVTVD